MKKLALLSAALLVAGCGEKSSSEGSESVSEEPSGTQESLSDADVERLLKEAVEYESLQERNDLYYQVNESESYSGWVKEMYDSGQVRSLLRLKKDGNLDGPWLKWYENGQKHLEQTYKDGQLDGPFTGWDENGQKWSERTYKDGKEDGPYTNWHQNGQKQQEGACKDGELDGLMTMWHENGQKAAEVTFKDGKEVSAKYWNSKGEDVETWEEANQ